MTKANSLISLFLVYLATASGFVPFGLLPSKASIAQSQTSLFTSNHDNNYHENDSEAASRLSKTEEVSRRVALVMAAATVAAGGNLPAAVAMPLSGKVEALEFENKDLVNIKGAPEKHLPLTTVTDAGDAKSVKVKVVVPHVMDREKPHFIEFVWLKDEENNKVIAAKRFKATDPAPPTLTASVDKGTKLRALLFCNLHGLWQGEAFAV